MVESASVTRSRDSVIDHAILRRSRTIAGLMGPTLVAIAAGMLLNLGSYPAIAEQISRDAALIVLSGVLVFVAGLAILRVHNVWTGWPVLVTVLGWVALLGGLARMLLPTQIAAMAPGLARNTALIATMAAVLLVLGAFLTFKAYARA